MDFKILSFSNGGRIPEIYAFGAPGEDGPFRIADNRNPHLIWEGAPAGTKSFAILCVDRYVPSKSDDVNQEGKFVPKDLPRVDFYHWVLVDIPSHVCEIKEGEASSGVTARGKETGRKPYGIAGVNNYTDWFVGDIDMEGTYGDYDGPCPPWNDELIHQYHFCLYALEVPSLQLGDNFRGEDVLKAMQGKVLAEAVWVGNYTMNKKLL